jgi:hypothetical protein
MHRRTFLAGAAASLHAAAPPNRTPVAAIITCYYRNSHADVFIGNMLRGFWWEGKPHESELVIPAMYLEQTPATDIGVAEANKYGIVRKPTVADAIVPSAKGVVLIGEHGDYPLNAKGQKLYPRYELMEKIVAEYRRSKRALPLFCDKHFSIEWKKAKQMFDWSRELGFPLIAGTSLTLTWRRPALELGLDVPLKRAVGYFYGGRESYGYHGIENYQSMVERRPGGETGVDWVQSLDGAEVWRWTAANPWARNLLEEALRHDDSLKHGALESIVTEPMLFLTGYRSGLLGVMYMLNGMTERAGFAAEIDGKSDPVSCSMILQWGRPWSHGNGLSYYVERTMVEGREFYPPERTLLATGITEAIMDSAFQGGKRIATPHLNVRYRAQRESLFMKGPLPPYDRVRM